MDTYTRLIAFLDEQGAQYRLIDHAPEGRTELVSPMRGNALSQAAKCIVLMHPDPEVQAASFANAVNSATSSSVNRTGLSFGAVASAAVLWRASTTSETPLFWSTWGRRATGKTRAPMTGKNIWRLCKVYGRLIGYPELTSEREHGFRWAAAHAN